MSEMIKNFGQMMNNKNMSGDMQKMFNNMNGSNGFNSCGNTNCQNNTCNNKNNGYSNNYNKSFNKKNYNNINSNSSQDKSSFTSNNNNFERNDNNIFENMNSDSTNNIFGNIDMETIMKMQKIMSSMNSKETDSRTNLLMSLKPYLKESRKNKVDQYVQLLKMEKIFEVMNPLGR